ncbi:MAG: hypothetical protein ACFE95_07130 [Candidatus Hodarchaeota archaeon]
MKEKKVEFCCKNQGEYIIDDEPECANTVFIPEYETKNLLPRILKVPMRDVAGCFPESPRISAILSKYEDPDTGKIMVLSESELLEFGKEIRSGDESFSIHTSSY